MIDRLIYILIQANIQVFFQVEYILGRQIIDLRVVNHVKIRLNNS